MRLPHTPLRPACLLAAAILLLAHSKAAASVPGWWSGVGLHDLKGVPVDLSGKWVVVVFLGQDCPVSNAAVPVLNKLAAEFGPKGFEFIGAYVDPTADLASLRVHAADYGLGFATADDRSHALARIAGASYTPEVAVFSADGVRMYSGRIDDRVGDLGASRPVAAHQDLRDVLIAIASGSKGPFEGKPGYGCAIPEAVHP